MSGSRPAAAAVSGGASRGWLAAVLQLTKPSIILLVLVTGMAALSLEGSLLGDPLRLALVLLGLFLTGGSANAFNQYFERDIDARMERTRRRRPLPKGELRPATALIAAITLGVSGVALFALFFSMLSAVLALVTVVFYGFFYTLYLKPRTHLNIVIGGAAGAMAPPIAWAAATGTTAPIPWLLFGIIFLWTPPHFWALALFRKPDYEAVGLPMLPVVRGDRATMNQILVYTWLTVLASLALPLFGLGIVYSLGAVVLGVIFLRFTLTARREPSALAERRLFGFSIVYLLALSCTMIIEGLV